MTSTQPIRIHIIADYGGDQRNLNDLAFAEVENKFNDIARLESNVRFEFSRISVGAFNTVEAAFVLAQLTLNQINGGRDIYFVNVAPRHDEKSARHNNQGEKLVAGILPSGAAVFAVNSGYTLSFLRDQGIEFREVNCNDAGSQFRSRDIFPYRTAEFAIVAAKRGKQYKELFEGRIKFGKQIDPESIPQISQDTVLYVDGYGNVKLNATKEAIQGKFGDIVTVHVEGQSFKLPYEKGIFGVKDGALVLAPGSSGWNGSQFLEIVKRSGNAARELAPKIQSVKPRRAASLRPGDRLQIGAVAKGRAPDFIISGA